MRYPSCTFCELPVVEVSGQFQKLDSYYLSQDDSLKGSAGYWHTSCLVSSPYGAAWRELRLRNYVSVRGYQAIAQEKDWSVIRNPRTDEHVALSESGNFLSLVFPAGRIRRSGDGAFYRVKEPEYNLHLQDASVIRAVQAALIETGTFPVLALFEALGISDRVQYPEALEGALMHFERALQRNWGGHSVAARWEYGVFVPAELEQYVRA